jgi:hypothetical protein
MQKRMVFVVGHKNWGKSRTIRALLAECGTVGKRLSVLVGLKDDGYRLYFWAMRHSFYGVRELQADEIKQMKQYGKVEVFEDKSVSAEKRAKALRTFIETEVLGK